MSLLSRFLTKTATYADAFARSTAPVDPERRPSATSAVASHLAHTTHDLNYVLNRGRPFHLDDIPAYVDALRNVDGGPGLDDRKMLLEKVLVLMSRLPPDSVFAKQLEVVTIDLLYKDLPHPPESYLPLLTTTSPSTSAFPVSTTSPGGIKSEGSYVSTSGYEQAEMHRAYSRPALSYPNLSSSTYPLSQNDFSQTGLVVSRRPYAARSADGSGYSLTIPSLGMAGMPYARTVPPTTPIYVRTLPDPGLVFDTLLARRPSHCSDYPTWERKGDIKRLPSSDPHATPGHTVLPETDKDGFAPHPGGLNSLFFAFADLIIHSVFNSSHSQPGVNDVSSYLDLSPLYGSSKADNDKVRRQDGSGRLWEDVFADGRILFMPPSVGALLILFCRNHNYIASKLLQINENGYFVEDLQSLSPEDRQAQDDELFARSRLVNCGWFMQGILRDYVGSILGLVRDGYDWRLDPLAASRELDHSVSERGRGNMVSMEFNFMYRWHHSLSKEDTKWTESIFARVLGMMDVEERQQKGENVWKINIEDFTRAVADNIRPPSDVKTWTFDGPNGISLQRDPVTGSFHDEDLAKILQNATRARAGAFKARGIPEVLRVVEVLGITQSRAWGACTMNDFRRFMGLKPFASFSEWNSDPEISRSASALYGGDIEQLELYVGLQAEEGKPPIEGAGLCSGYTITRAILADAVALVRGDRFLTTEFNIFNLTSWGYQDAFAQMNDGAYGGEITRLLYRTLPGYYPVNSAYARFAFLDPEFMKEVLLKRSADVNDYDFEKPGVKKEIIVVDGAPAREILVTGGKEGGSLSNISRIRIGQLLEKKDFDTMKFGLVGDTLNHLNLDGRYGTLLGQVTEKLLTERSLSLSNPDKKCVDIVKDVLSLVPVYFVSEELIGLPLKTYQSPLGEYRDSELRDMFDVVANYVFENKDEYMAWVLRQEARKTVKIGNHVVTEHLKRLMSQGLITKLTNPLTQIWKDENKRSDTFLSELLSRARKEYTSRNTDKCDFIELVANTIVANLLPSTAIYAKAAVNIVDAFLSEDIVKKNVLINAAVNPTGWGINGENRRIIWMYACKVLGFSPPVSSLLFDVKERVSIEKSNFESGQILYCNMIIANQNSEKICFGLDEYGLISMKFLETTLPEVLRVIFRLEGIRRVDGPSGKVNGFIETPYEPPELCPEVRFITAKRGNMTPFPVSLIAEFDPIV